MRPLRAIAQEIAIRWSNQGKGIYFGAKPYLEAMAELSSIKENFFADSGKSVVLYFLANASGFRGPEARRLKAELKDHLKTC